RVLHSDRRVRAERGSLLSRPDPFRAGRLGADGNEAGRGPDADPDATARRHVCPGDAQRSPVTPRDALGSDAPGASLPQAKGFGTREIAKRNFPDGSCGIAVTNSTRIWLCSPTECLNSSISARSVSAL